MRFNIQISTTLFGWLCMLAGADLLQEKNTVVWLVLVADADTVWEKNTIYWLADKPAE